MDDCDFNCDETLLSEQQSPSPSLSPKFVDRIQEYQDLWNKSVLRTVHTNVDFVGRQILDYEPRRLYLSFTIIENPQTDMLLLSPGKFPLFFNSFFVNGPGNTSPTSVAAPPPLKFDIFNDGNIVQQAWFGQANVLSVCVRTVECILRG